VLWRALCGIKGGFYVDVGAFHPEHDSVTKVFYDNGWSGINIEPSPFDFEQFLNSRSRDINLNIAASSTEGKAVLFCPTDNPALNTIEKRIYENYWSQNLEINAIEISTRTLTSILDEYEVKDIHFLKVDVEGHEKDVLEGLDLTRHRPWVIVIESINSQCLRMPEDIPEIYDTSDEWEPNLINNGYIACLFDGINKFYVAREKAEQFMESLSVPANCLDELTRSTKKILDELLRSDLSRLQKLTDQNIQLARDLNSLAEDVEHYVQLIFEQGREIRGLNATIHDLHHKLNISSSSLNQQMALSENLYAIYIDLQNQVSQMKASRSWKITAPIRFATGLVRRGILS
jgi:FkbM family methyltransferase